MSLAWTFSRILRLEIKKLNRSIIMKIFLSYILCLFNIKALAEAANAALSAREMDELIVRKAGFNG